MTNINPIWKLRNFHLENLQPKRVGGEIRIVLKWSDQLTLTLDYALRGNEIERAESVCRTIRERRRIDTRHWHKTWHGRVAKPRSMPAEYDQYALFSGGRHG